MEDVLLYRQESSARPKNVKIQIDQIENALEDEKIDDAKEALRKLEKILGESNSEYKKMAGMIEDAEMIWGN